MAELPSVSMTIMTLPASCCFVFVYGRGGGVTITKQGVGVRLGIAGRSTNSTIVKGKFRQTRNDFRANLSLLAPAHYCQWTLFRPFRAPNVYKENHPGFAGHARIYYRRRPPLLLLA